MKSTQGIIEELSTLKASLRADSDEPLKNDEILDRFLSLMIELAKNVRHAAVEK